MPKVAPGEEALPFGYMADDQAESPVTCCGTCLVDCCVPCTTLCCCCYKLAVCPPSGAAYKVDDPFWRGLKFRLCHRMQAWLIRHPCSESIFSCFCCIRPCITIHDVAAYGTTAIKGFRDEIGPVWCDNLKVEVADEEMMKLIMTSPQDGGPALGQAWLREHKLPHCAADGSRLFPIGMANDHPREADDAVGMHKGKLRTPGQESARHAHLRGLIFTYLINDASRSRQRRSDTVTARLFADLHTVVHAPGANPRKWSSSKAGLAGFILRYIHWVCFGLDLSDQQFEELWLCYYTPGPGLGEASIILEVQAYIGRLLELAGNTHFKQHPQRRAAVRAVYRESPALRGWSEEETKLDDFLEMTITVLGLAGLQGPKGAAAHMLLNYKGFIPGSTRGQPPTQYPWPYGDHDKLRLAVLEAMRMQPAVFGSGLTAPAPLRCPLGQSRSQAVVFPAGSAVHCNFVALNWDAGVWGPKAAHFDPAAHASQLWGDGVPYPNFNSWGGSKAQLHTGRECPGKDLSITMLIDLVDLVIQPDANSLPTPPPSPPDPQAMARG